MSYKIPTWPFAAAPTDELRALGRPEFETVTAVEAMFRVRRPETDPDYTYDDNEAVLVVELSPGGWAVIHDTEFDAVVVAYNRTLADATLLALAYWRTANEHPIATPAGVDR